MKRVAESPFNVRFDEFEGPLDLLLHLVRRREMPIRDLPLGKITAEYLETLEFMRTIELEPAGAFLEVAATLTRLKARELLPAPVLSEDLEARAVEDASLLERLVEHQVVRMTAEKLHDHKVRAASVWFRGEATPSGVEQTEREIVEADLFSLVTAFRNLLADVHGPEALQLARENFSIEECADEIRRRFEGGRPVPFEELFEASVVRGKLIATFLALLELIRSSEARAFQDGPLGRILVFPAEPAAEVGAASEHAES